MQSSEHRFRELRNEGFVGNMLSSPQVRCRKLQYRWEFQLFLVRFSFLWVRCLETYFCCLLQQGKQSSLFRGCITICNDKTSHSAQMSVCFMWVLVCLWEQLNMEKRFNPFSMLLMYLQSWCSQNWYIRESLSFCFLWELKTFYYLKDSLPWGTLHAVAQQATIIKWLQATGRHFLSAFPFLCSLNFKAYLFSVLM